MGHPVDQDVQSIHADIQPHLSQVPLTRAPLGSVYNTPYWGGGGAIHSPPPNSETTGPIVKIQTASDSPGKTVERNLISLTSRSPMTSQVRSK